MHLAEPQGTATAGAATVFTVYQASIDPHVESIPMWAFSGRVLLRRCTIVESQSAIHTSRQRSRDNGRPKRL